MNWFKSFWSAPTPASSPKEVSALNFTPRAQQVLALARQEADRFHHHFVGTEHLLLGMIRLGQGTAVTVLGKLGLDLDVVRVEVEKLVGIGPDQIVIGSIPYTPRVKKVLAHAANEARALNHTYVGTEHILLGLLLEGDGVAARVLKNLGVNVEQTRMAIVRELDPSFPDSPKDTRPAENPQHAVLPNTRFGSIDTTKRYDVFCSERNQQGVVYRSALFKGRRKLLSTQQFDIQAEFLELEQSNGQTVYLSSSSVVKFCEHGAAITGEIVPPG